MKAVILVGLAVIWVASPSVAAEAGSGDRECRYRASFNCAKADDAMSRAICTTPDLLAADCAMGYAYRDARDRTGPDSRDDLRNSQRKWVALRDAHCEKRAGAEMVPCLKGETERRIRWLIDRYHLPGTGMVYDRYRVIREK